ncbi:MAG TPA: tetratricopeptide repeat protein, partial [Polyangiaceae bacterium]
QADTLSFANIAGVNHHPGYFDFVLLPGAKVGGTATQTASGDRETQPVPIPTSHISTASKSMAPSQSPAPARGQRDEQREQPTVKDEPPIRGEAPATESLANSDARPADDREGLTAASDAVKGEGEPKRLRETERDAEEEPTAPGVPLARLSPAADALRRLGDKVAIETTVGKHGERRVPTLADTPRARAASQRDWISEATYFPSAPPPAVRPVQPGLSRPPQVTLPGISGQDVDLAAAPERESELPDAATPSLPAVEPVSRGSEELPSFEPSPDAPNSTESPVGSDTDETRELAPKRDRSAPAAAASSPVLSPETPAAGDMASDKLPSSAAAAAEPAPAGSTSDEAAVGDVPSTDSLSERLPSFASPFDDEPYEDSPSGALPSFASDLDEPEPSDSSESHSASHDVSDDDGGDTIAQYEAMLAELEATEDPQRAEIQSRLGDALREAGRIAEALFAYERALDIDPFLTEAFEGACALYLQERDFAGLVSTIRRRMDVSEDPGERMALLDHIADIWLHEVEDPLKAIQAIEERLTVTPGDVHALQTLIEAQDQLGDAMGRLDSRERLARCEQAELDLRAAAWIEAADIACNAFDDLARSYLALESAIRTGTLLPHALARAETLFGAKARWLEVLELYELSLEIARTVADAVKIGRRVLRLISERGCESAVKASTLAVLIHLSHHDAQIAEATMALAIAITSGQETLELLQQLRTAQPRHVALLHTVVELSRARQPDVAANVSSLLSALESATEGEKELSSALPVDNLPTPSRSLEQKDYESLLVPAELDSEMTLGFARLERALFAVGAFDRRTEWAVPKDAPVIDPETSTATLARVFLWTSRLLSVKAPGLVVLADAPTLFRYAPEQEARLFVSRSLGSGFSLQELVYLVARQAVLQLPGMIVREHYPEAKSLGGLLYA